MDFAASAAKLIFFWIDGSIGCAQTRLG